MGQAKSFYFKPQLDWSTPSLNCLLTQKKMSFDSMPKYRRASYSSTKIIKILKWVQLKGLENGDTKKLLMVLKPSFKSIFLENVNGGKNVSSTEILVMKKYKIANSIPRRKSDYCQIKTKELLVPELEQNN